MYTYSIIIPYRDTIKLLHKAVSSIAERSDIQIIIVDNSDSPLYAADIPSRGNSDVLYITSDSKLGAGRARNEGLKYALGKWILFLDADDYFFNGAFDVFDKYKATDYDIIFFDSDSIKLKDGTRSTRHIFIHECLDSFIKNQNEDALRYKFVNPISKMFRADFLLKKGFVFEEIPVSNDMMFSIKTGHAAQKIIGDPSVVYMITEGEDNTSLTRTRSAGNQFVRYQTAIKQYHFMESIGRLDLRFHLFSFVYHAFIDYGIAEGFNYLKYAYKEHVNIFLK